MTPDEVMKELGPHTGLQVVPLDYEGNRVSDVIIRYTGQKQTVDRNRLLDMLATKKGSKYSEEVVNKDLERLVQKGLVSGNTTITLEPTGEESVRVVFNVTPHNLLAGVGFRGVTAFTEKELREETKLVGGQALSDQAVNTALTNIRNYYQESRYPDAVITYQYQKTERPGFVDLVFNVVEQKKANIVRIEFVGNEHYDRKILHNVMKTKEKGWLTWITKSGRIDREQLEDDLADLVTFYRNEGYLRARLLKVEQLADPKAKKSSVTLRITIEEGKKYVVNKVAFGPTHVFTAKELEKGLSLYNGDAYSAKLVADDVQMIRKYYGSRGYADAAVTPDIHEVGEDSRGRGLIDIIYRVVENNPYRVGHIAIAGNVKTKDYVIRRELPLQSNDPLNSVDIETAQKRLQNMGYFDMVDISQSASSRPGYRDVNVEVRERGTGMLNVGVAFSSIESVFLFFTVTQSNFDLYDWRSFVGGGQRFSFNTRLGTETQMASVSWVDPWFLDRKLSFGTEIFYSRSTYFSDFYDQQNYGVAFTLRKPLGDLDYLRMEYRIEQFEIDSHWDAPLFFQQEAGTYTRSHVEMGYVFDNRDAQITPRKGGKFEILGGYSGLGGDVKTYNAGLSAEYYVNLKWDTIFSIKTAWNTVEGIKDDKHVPIFERMYLGGPYDLRGFRFRDVAPYDAELSGDETMGGKTSWFAQFEYTVPVIEELRLAFFYDIGFVHASSFSAKAKQFASDWGIGLRLNLPMGPLAVDYAIPVLKNNAIDHNGQFQFYLNVSY